MIRKYYQYLAAALLAAVLVGCAGEDRKSK